MFNKLTTNHEAEYIGLIHGLKAAANVIATTSTSTSALTSTTATAIIKTAIKHIHVYGDSELVINQMNNIPQVLQKSLDNLILSRLHQQAILHANRFTCDITFEWIPRYRNVLADKLVKLIQISSCSINSSSSCSINSSCCDNTITIPDDDTSCSNTPTSRSSSNTNRSSSSFELIDNNTNNNITTTITTAKDNNNNNIATTTSSTTTNTIDTNTTSTASPYETTDWFLPLVKTACLLYSSTSPVIVVHPSNDTTL